MFADCESWFMKVISMTVVIATFRSAAAVQVYYFLID